MATYTEEELKIPPARYECEYFVLVHNLTWIKWLPFFLQPECVVTQTISVNIEETREMYVICFFFFETVIL